MTFESAIEQLCDIDFKSIFDSLDPDRQALLIIEAWVISQNASCQVLEKILGKIPEEVIEGLITDFENLCETVRINRHNVFVDLISVRNSIVEEIKTNNKQRKD